MDIVDILCCDGADDALGKWLDDILAFLQRSDLEAEDGSTIFLGDRHILRDVDEAAGQVTGVRCFQSGVGQTLTRAVDRKSTRLNSSHMSISYAVFCLKKKKSNKHKSSRRRVKEH